MIKEFYFTISLTSEEFLPYYHGHFDSIQVVTTQGIKVRFPAMHLRKFVTMTGIHGKFLLITENNKFKSMTKLS